MTPRPKHEPVTAAERSFRPSEVALMLGINSQTLWRWGNRGLIRFNQLPGERRYTSEHIREFCAKQGIDVPKEAQSTVKVETDES